MPRVGRKRDKRNWGAKLRRGVKYEEKNHETNGIWWGWPDKRGRTTILCEVSKVAQNYSSSPQGTDIQVRTKQMTTEELSNSEGGGGGKGGGRIYTGAGTERKRGGEPIEVL